MVYVANPLYDAVFKYLMEDERIAKTILSALLQKEVLEVKMRRNEYSNINRNAISMFQNRLCRQGEGEGWFTETDSYRTAEDMA